MADDIKITNGHLELLDGDLQLVKDVNRIVQHIDTGLHLLKGDWILDSTAGIDYFGGLRAYPEIMSAQIKQEINSVKGVDMVLKYNFYQDDNQIDKISATVKIGNAEIPINSEITYTSGD